jgi:hypothetical protein
MAYAHIDEAIITHEVVASAREARLTYIIRFKAKKILNGEGRGFSITKSTNDIIGTRGI